MSQHLMIVPSLACPAKCKYCFGPHEGGTSMRRETMEAIVKWQKRLEHDDALEITFHGGEPLVPGVEFYRVPSVNLRELFFFIFFCLASCVHLFKTYIIFHEEYF